MKLLPLALLTGFTFAALAAGEPAPSPAPPAFGFGVPKEWAELSAAKKATIDKLVQRVRESLPKGWSVNYVPALAQLRVSRDEAALCHPEAIVNDYVGHVRAPESNHILFTLRLSPFLTPQEFAAQVEAQRALGAKLAALQKQLDDMHMTQKFDSYSPHTDAQKAAVAEYEALKRTRTDLPEFFFDDVGLRWDDVDFVNGEPHRRVIDAQVRAECAKVRETTAGLLTPYIKAK